MALLTTAASAASAVGGGSVLKGGVDKITEGVGAVGDVLGLGGGGGPDPSGTSTVGSAPIRAVLKEDRTDQDGSDPGTLRVGEGTHRLQGVGWAGYTRAVSSLDSGYELTVQDSNGNSVTYQGPINRTKNFRDRGIDDSSVVAVRVQRASQGRQGNNVARNDGQTSTGTTETSATQIAGNSRLIVVALVVGVLGYLAAQ